MDGSTKHIRVAYLYIGQERGVFTEGIDLKLVLVPAYPAGTALIARQLDSMELAPRVRSLVQVSSDWLIEEWASTSRCFIPQCIGRYGRWRQRSPRPNAPSA